MKAAGLFSGMGGFELAFSRSGFEAVFLAEIDPEARAVLKRNFPHVDLREDVSQIKTLPKDLDVLLAGFPCQDLSMVGPRTGIAGQKSGVVGSMIDLIKRTRVPTVIIENVYFMLHLDRGAAMRWLVEQLEGMEYAWAYRVLDTMGFGLPQRRRRVYLVASRTIDPRSVLFADEAPARPAASATLSSPLGFYWTEGRSGIGLTVDGIPPLKVGSSIGIPSAPAVLFPDGEVLMPSVRACARLQGFPSRWMSQHTGANGRNPHWRLVGNAVSVPVATWVARRLLKPKRRLEFAISALADDRHWPDAAYNVDGRRIAVSASDKPLDTHTRSIECFRDATWVRLSDKALDGFIRRAMEGGLSTPAGFLDALRRAKRRARLAA